MTDITDNVLISPCDEMLKAWNGFATEHELVAFSSWAGRFWCLTNVCGHAIRIVTDPIFALLAASGIFAGSLMLSPLIACISPSFACRFIGCSAINIASSLALAAFSPFCQTVLMARALAGAIFHPGAYYYKDYGFGQFTTWRHSGNTEIVGVTHIEKRHCKILKDEAKRLSKIKVPPSTDDELNENKQLFLAFLEGKSYLIGNKKNELQAYAHDNGWLDRESSLDDLLKLSVYRQKKLCERVRGRTHLVTNSELNTFTAFIDWVAAGKYQDDKKFSRETQKHYYQVMQESLATLSEIWAEKDINKKNYTVSDDKKASAISALAEVATECKPARVAECQRQLLEIQEPKTPAEFIAHCIAKCRESVIDTLVVEKGDDVEQYNDANRYRQCIGNLLEGIDVKLAKRDMYAELKKSEVAKYQEEFFDLYTKKTLLEFVRAELNDENLWKELDKKAIRLADRKDMRAAWISVLYGKGTNSEDRALKKLYDELNGDAFLMQKRWTTSDEDLFLTDDAIAALLKDEFKAIDKATGNQRRQRE